MRIEKNKNQLLLGALAVGFFVGILYENLLVGKQGTVPELFQKHNLQRYLQIKIIQRTYLWYVVKERFLVFGVFCMLGFVKWKRIAACICPGIIGFLFGILTVSAVLQMGIWGLFFCLAGMFPHIFFYGIGWIVIIYHWYRYPNRKWERMKSLFVIIAFLLGVLAEVYVNPWIMKWIIPIVLR